MRWVIDLPHALVEASGVLWIAALRAGRIPADDAHVVVVTTGRNVSLDALLPVLRARQA